MGQNCVKESYSISKKQNSRKVKSLYKWLSKVTGVDACWIEGTQEDESPAWAVIKRIAGSSWYIVRSSLWRKTAIASLAVIPLLFSPAKLNAQHTGLIEDYMVGSPHGFQVSGASDGDNLGRKKTLAFGDINGDGIDDLILGAFHADANGSNAGETYVIFGSSANFSSSFDLTDLDGSDGFVIAGIADGDQAGRSVASGDINGDGYDDVIVGAPKTYFSSFYDSNDYYYFRGYDGAAYVIFGGSTAFADTVQLSSLGSDGFVVRGDTFDQIGYSLATGDVNGDGFDDLITGGQSNFNHGYYEYYLGSGDYIYSESFVVFGDSAITDTVRISGLDGSDGFKMREYYGGEYHFGSQVSSGDLDGDGYDEVIVSSEYNNIDFAAGTTHVIFGQSSGFSSEIDVETMDASTGFKLFGFSSRYYSGETLAIGDVDGDSTDDLLIGATGSDVNANRSGQTYVVFGDTDGFTSNIDLSSLDGTTGFTLNGIEENDRSGSSLAVGDINDDGINDIIIGASWADRTNPTTNASGDVYVVFGQSSGFSSVIELSSLDESTGFTLQGQSASDVLGSEVLVADFDGNNQDELIIGASSAEPDGGGGTSTGIVYVFTQPVLNQEVTGDEGFRTLGAPAYGSLFDNLLKNFWTQGFGNANTSVGSENVWTWDTGSQAWTPLTNLDINSLDRGHGFLFYIFSDDDYDTTTTEGFPKTLSTFNLVADGSETLKFNSGSVTPVDDLDPGDFFFAGNPYMYTVDWDGFIKNGMSNTVYVYDDANDQWQTWTGSVGGLTDGLLAPFQGFFAQANSAGSGGSLVMEKSDTVSVSVNLLKTAPAKVLKLTAETEERSSNAWLSFQQGGEVGRDDYDALALQSLGSTWLRMATVISNQDLLQVNALPPDQAEELRFPLTLSGTGLQAETAIISVEGMEQFEGWSFVIHDLETEEAHPLSAGDTLNLPIDQVLAKEASSLMPASPIPIKAKTDGHRFELVITPSTTVTNEPISELPAEVELKQNYPNPFNPVTNITYTLPLQSSVRLEVFDLMGRKVATLVDGNIQTAGEYTVRFDASRLASGMYIYHLQIGEIRLTRKLTLIK